ncbi:MAG: putative DNA binding domain-containing protein [Bacteroidales bacterium]|jgi:predicted HTH transcriptional regulator|nr:putative DNA binding domain-containing protein [Bacteroidales bacterium]
MTKNELLRRLSDIEWDDFEVKGASHELPKNIWETVSAFSNTAGGWIVLGVSQKEKTFEITGIKEPERLEQNFTTVLRNRNKFNALITPKCRKYEIDGFKVLAFYIPASEHRPVYYNSLSNTFIRTASGDQRASESEINAMFRDQLFGVMSARPVERTTLNDLNRTTLYRYRDYMSRFNPSLPYNKMPDSEFLERMQVTEDNHLTYGGLLFMGKNLAINKSFPDFRIDLLEIPGKSYADAVNRYTFRLEEQENLWEYYFAIIERLKRHVDMPFRMNSLGIAVEDSPQFEAVREALVNMLMHTDYFSVMKSRVRIFSNRIEFENPGAFPRPINELLKKDISIPRNPVLAKLFRCAKLAENAGYGFDKMLNWEKSTHTTVVFENTIDMSLVIFPFGENIIEKAAEIENTVKIDTDIIKKTKKGTEKNSRKETEKVTRKNTEKVTKKATEDITKNIEDVPERDTENTEKVTRKNIEKVTKKDIKKVTKKGVEKIIEEVTENQKTVLNIINKNPRITLNELSKIVGISLRKVKENISKLKTKGLLEHIGSNKGGYWKVIKNKDN